IMADQASLQVAPRSVMGRHVKRLRREGIIPANIYGRHQPSQALQVDSYAFERFLAGHHLTRVVNLQVDSNGGTLNALVRHISRSPRTGKVLHVDFLRVSMNEPITVRVPIRLIGEAPAVKVEGGVLLHLLDTVEVEALPADLPEALELDISKLIELDAALYIRDLPIPANVTLLSEPEEPVVKVIAPRAVLAEEAKAEAEAAAAPAEAAAETTESES
ncbi:MAG TPA: 50S ribosomal protein L25, partial [Ktedonobacterales bacterium]|nr:50S ribosomal protein L25 [Ktedonobacterales bacterium]